MTQDELTANGESVVSLILTLMPKVDRKMQEDLVRTASLWVQCCRIKVEVVVKTGIHSIGFGALAVPELFEEGITLINSLLERCVVVLLLPVCSLTRKRAVAL